MDIFRCQQELGDGQCLVAAWVLGKISPVLLGAELKCISSAAPGRALSGLSLCQSSSCTDEKAGVGRWGYMFTLTLGLGLTAGFSYSSGGHLPPNKPSDLNSQAQCPPPRSHCSLSSHRFSKLVPKSDVPSTQ